MVDKKPSFYPPTFSCVLFLYLQVFLDPVTVCKVLRKTAAAPGLTVVLDRVVLMLWLITVHHQNEVMIILWLLCVEGFPTFHLRTLQDITLSFWILHLTVVILCRTYVCALLFTSFNTCLNLFSLTFTLSPEWSFVQR